MKTLDKKQIPQFAALCVLSAGLFGYFVLKVVAPGTAAAGTLPAAAAKPNAAKPAGVPSTGPAAADGKPGSDADPKADSQADAVAPDAPPPSAGMRDPFAVGYVDPKTVAPAATPVPKMPALGKQMVSLLPAPISFPGAPALPTRLSGFPIHSGPAALGLPTGPAVPPLPSIPAAPAAPTWTVTGVLQGGAEQVAVLRSGDARRIVRAGDLVDSTYRVVGVSRTSVVLRHGTALYRLPLGGPKEAAGKPAAPTTAGTAPAVQTPAQTTAPVTPAAAPSPAAPDTIPASLSGLAGQLQQALPPSAPTEAPHG